MPLIYAPPLEFGALRQGEILGDIWIHTPVYPPIAIAQDTSIDIDSVHHPLMVVMTADCDLEWDFNARFPNQQAQENYRSFGEVEKPGAIIPHVLLCDVYEEDRIRGRIVGSDIWRRIKRNQDERYHHFSPAPIGNSRADELPDLFLDFKKTLALPTESLYEGLRVDGIRRVALVPPIYIHDLMHRFYGFLSRVGLPE